MPNVVRQIVGDLSDLGGVYAGKVGVYVETAGGVSLAVTRADVVAQYQAAAGTAAQKKQAVIAWLKSLAQSTFGVARIGPSSITAFDFDAADGTPLTLEITS